MLEDYWECWVVSIDPPVERRGIGTMLCQRAADQAQADRVPVVPQSTAAPRRRSGSMPSMN
jgi:GNAT superfamily N-acetyltransferase